MKNCLKFFWGFRRATPWNASILTWEWTAAYEKCPAEKELRSSFQSDFPETVEKLTDGFFLLWPLISFNSPEGRRFRYLAVLVDKNVYQGVGCRCLPRQLWLYGAADRLLRGIEKPLAQESSDGNALFYHWGNNELSVLIFFEGRLCHWIEEAGYGTFDLVEDRLESLKIFLKRDALFGRSDSYDFIQIDHSLDLDGRRDYFFRVASRDPFWKKRSLFSHPAEKTTSFKWLGWCVVIILMVLAAVMTLRIEPAEGILSDVLPPELSAPAINDVRDIRDESLSRKVYAERQCLVDSLRIQGTVGERLFLAQGKTFCVGDSLGDFLVRKIHRNGVDFFCQGRPYFVEVR